MKKQTAAIGVLTMLCFLLVIWLPCQADDNIYICKNTNTEKPRFVNAPTKCKKTEYLVTLTAGNQGPQGPAGADGVANGISTAVHGEINIDGTINHGTGFTVDASGPVSSGIYNITFNPPFSHTPTCVVSFQNTPSTWYKSVTCTFENLNTDSVRLYCMQIAGTLNSGKYDVTAFDADVQAQINFICVD